MLNLHQSKNNFKDEENYSITGAAFGSDYG